MYIGNDLQIAHPSYKIIDDISSGFNGSQTSFALQVSGATPVPFPISTQQVMISVNGVVQEPDPNGSAGFKLLGSNIVFSSAPANGHAFFGVINAGADYVTAGSEFPDGSATAPSFTFQDDQDTGWFRNASGDVGYSSNGTAILNFDGNGLTIAAGKGLTVDTNTLKVDAANNRVGIGTASPSCTLNVTGSNAQAAIFQTSLSSTTLSVVDSDGDGINIAGGSAYGHRILTNTTEALKLGVNNAVKLTIDSSGDSTFAGDVIVDDIQADRIMHRGDVNTTIRFPAADTFAVETGGSERLRVDSSGRLLIGDTTHRTGQKLEVSDTGSTGSLSLRRYSANAHPSYVDFFKSRSGTLGGETVVQSGDNLGQITWGGSDGTDRAYAAFISGVVDGTPGDGDMPGRLVFSTSADGSESPTERMRIDSSGSVLIDATSSSDAGGDGNDLVIGSTSDAQKGITIINSTTGKGNIFFSDGAGYKNQCQIKYDHNIDKLTVSTATVLALSIDNSQNATFAGTVSDSKGDLRKIIRNVQTSAYVLVAADAGKCVLISSGGVTLNTSTFSDGQAVTIVNNSGSDQTITQGSGVTLYNTADATTGNRTLAGRGMATIWCGGGTTFYISGAGLS